MSQMIETFMTAGAQGPLRAQPIELQEVNVAPASTPALLREPNPLRSLRVELRVCVGAAVMTLGELLSAREDEVLRLERTVDQPVDLLLDGSVVARGELMAVDGSFAVRITELPLPLRL
jgi:flagellar motor switch protein FliN